MLGNMGNNNGNSDRSVNTKIRTFYSDISCLQMTYWNENISLKINPLQSVNADGIRQYDFNRRANTALTSDKCIALKQAIDKVITPKMNEVKTTGILDKPVNVGVQVGKQNSSAIFIEYKNDNNTPYVYLTIYTNIGQDGKAPKDGVYSYKFAKINIVENYDPESGTGTDSFVDAEFMFFYDKLKNISDICGTAAHSTNVDSANKVSSSNYRSNNSGNRSGYGNSYGASNGTASSYSAPVSSLNNDEFPFS